VWFQTAKEDRSGEGKEIEKNNREVEESKEVNVGIETCLGRLLKIVGRRGGLGRGKRQSKQYIRGGGGGVMSDGREGGVGDILNKVVWGRKKKKKL